MVQYLYNKVFAQYERLSKNSGLVLNAHKTETLHTNRDLAFDIRYDGGLFRKITMKEFKNMWYLLL